MSFDRLSSDFLSEDFFMGNKEDLALILKNVVLTCTQVYRLW